MINFGCTTIEFDELVQCSFGINKTAYKVLLFLVNHPGSYSAQDIGEALHLDRTTVQKAVKTLHEKALVEKHQINFKRGGYSYLYSVKGKEVIKEKILRIIDEWTNAVKEQIKHW